VDIYDCVVNDIDSPKNILTRMIKL